MWSDSDLEDESEEERARFLSHMGPFLHTFFFQPSCNNISLSQQRYTTGRYRSNLFPPRSL